MAQRVVVVGAGVSGLSSAILLLYAGFDVEIWAKDLPENTVSAVAAAVIHPFLAEPQEKVTRWTRETINFFYEHIIDKEASGVFELPKTEYVVERKEPWWRDAVRDFEVVEDVPPGYTVGYRHKALMMDTSRYLPFLVGWLGRLGGTILQREIESLDQVNAKIVVNCTGLGARTLCGDESVFPIRGQVVVAAQKGCTESKTDADGPNRLAYINPRSDDIVLGGTSQENDWDETIRTEDREGILRRVAALDESMGDIDIIREAVGLRPCRPLIRLEKESVGGKVVIHNYGHGGSGYTVSWGCAKEVLRLVRRITPP